MSFCAGFARAALGLWLFALGSWLELGDAFDGYQRQVVADAAFAGEGGDGLEDAFDEFARGAVAQTRHGALDAAVAEALTEAAGRLGQPVRVEEQHVPLPERIDLPKTVARVVPVQRSE